MNRRTYLATVTLSLGGCMDYGTDPEGTESDDGTSEFGEGAAESVAVEAGTYDDFDELDDWLVAAGSLEADENRAYTGSQSARLEATDADDRVGIVTAPDRSLDLSGHVPGLAVAADEASPLRVEVYDGDGDFVRYRTRVEGGLPIMRHNFGVSYVAGEPDLTAISRIELSRPAGDESAADVWVDDLHFVPRPDAGVVLLQFDGGYETDYTRALPILEEAGVPATTFVTPDRLRGDPAHEGDRLTVGQVETLANAGWTIASHSARGLALTNVSDPTADVVGAGRWLETNGYGDGARFLSYPTGRYDESVLALAETHHDLAFGGRGAVHGYVTNPSLVPRVIGPNADDASALMDLTAELGGITSFVFHRLDDESASDLSEIVDALVDRESAGDLSIATPAELADQYRYRE
ncbi:polysaccharide deacetylase family protein [Halosolutus gelatinilyticus]|uniref:polysaccharide deacetylase family protein n=1 Tax=Halosolutus gelatinilyticus TaxID=2931975 RepID=UPI001FF2BF4F|nr:polysaccharide deacetylase family protein [Halosolutus gelatinilyticus]